uniref:PDZ domain-containing protein n=1 Tax=Biomphalaria glabrata TaxID=6526 RepID=A0A2C9L7I1_BIOGL
MKGRQFASYFINMVKEIIPSEDEREKLFTLLRQYQASRDLNRLLFDLRILLNEPNKLELYDIMRPMILMKHQIEYSKKVPAVPGVKLRLVRLIRRPGESLGFSVRGGYEHGVGIFVTQVTPDSQADRQGLRVGDEIVRVNGFNISEAIHEDVLNLIKSKDEILLKVTYIGMVPQKTEPSEPVKWDYVKQLLDDSVEDEALSRKGRPRDIKIFVDSTGYASIGCSILSDPGPAARYPGIYIVKVTPGSIAEEVGLEPGDQIIEVNDTSFRNITWKEAVLALKSSRQLHMIIRKKTGSQLLQRLNNRRDSVTSNITSLRRDSNTSNMAPIPRSSIDYGSNALSYDSNKELPPIPSSPDTDIPALQLSPEKEERRSSQAWNHSLHFEELKFVQQELARKRQLEGPSVPPPSSDHSPRATPPSMLSTMAEVHDSSIGVRRPSTDPSLLSGAAAIMAERKLSKQFNSLALLGPLADYEWISKVPGHIYELFKLEDLDGRPLKGLVYKKNLDLGIDIEGGIGSPLGGRILVSAVYEGGVAQLSGQIQVGDQLMMVNGQSLLNITIQQAEQILQQASLTNRDQIDIYYCETTLVNDEDNTTYF